MGHIITTIELVNAADLTASESGYIDESDVRRYSMEALVDTGSVMLALPQDVVEHLGLKERRKVAVTYADNRKEQRSIAGPLLVKVTGREMFTECVVVPPTSEALIGQIILEELDLIADCQKQALYPRPESPIYPLLNLK